MVSSQFKSRRGFMLILSSPSGAGKTTLSRRLLTGHGGLKLSISATTRPRRPAEIDGQDYYFLDEDAFNTAVEAGEFLEHAHVFGHHYGTLVREVDQHLEEGTDVLFDIDWQGTQQLAAKRREDVVSIFILPPSLAELERRLIQRGQDSVKVVRYRMERATEEIRHWQEYDYVMVNHDIDHALARIVHIIEAERSKRNRQTGIPAFVDQLMAEDRASR